MRFLVLDDDFIGDDFIGQYTIPFECLQSGQFKFQRFSVLSFFEFFSQRGKLKLHFAAASGYRHIPLSNNEGDLLENCTLFVHVAVTNRRGGGVINNFFAKFYCSRERCLGKVKNDLIFFG